MVSELQRMDFICFIFNFELELGFNVMSQATITNCHTIILL